MRHHDDGIAALAMHVAISSAAISLRRLGSSAANGSSSNSTGRLRTSARAKATPLPLAAGKRCRHALFEARQTDFVQRRGNRQPIARRELQRRMDAEPDIGEHVEMRKQVVVLKHQRYRPLRRVLMADILAPDQDPSRATAASKPASRLRNVDFPAPDGPGHGDDRACRQPAVEQKSCWPSRSPTSCISMASVMHAQPPSGSRPWCRQWSAPGR
jgi:hypothetical protein